MDILDMCYHSMYEKTLKELLNALPMKNDILTYYKEFDERERIADLYGKTVRVSEVQFPLLYNMGRNLAYLLKINMPEIFVFEDFYYGVQAKGVTNPWIEISAKTLQDLSNQQLNFLLGREFFKIVSGALETIAITNQLEKLIQGSIIPANEILSKGILLKSSKWLRLLNYSADNFGYLIVKDIVPCVKCILLLILNNKELVEKLNIREFIIQGDKISRLGDKVSRYTKNDEKIPYGPYRIKNLILFSTLRRYLLCY